VEIEFHVAVIVAVCAEVKDKAFARNWTRVSPWLMPTAGGRVMRLLFDERVIIAPPAGAPALRVTVQTSLEFAATLGEAQVRDAVIEEPPVGTPEEIAQVNAKACVDPLSNAVTLPLPDVVIDPAISWKLAVVCPAGTVTEAGTVRTGPTPFCIVTVEPPAGAAFVRVNEQVGEVPGRSVAVEHCKDCTPGKAEKDRPNDTEEFPKDAEMIPL
jgi:hypothetical protein